MKRQITNHHLSLPTRSTHPISQHTHAHGEKESRQAGDVKTKPHRCHIIHFFFSSWCEISFSSILRRANSELNSFWMIFIIIIMCIMCTWTGIYVEVALFFCSLLHHGNFQSGTLFFSLMHCDIIPLVNWFDRAAVDAAAVVLFIHCPLFNALDRPWNWARFKYQSNINTFDDEYVCACVAYVFSFSHMRLLKPLPLVMACLWVASVEENKNELNFNKTKAIASVFFFVRKKGSFECRVKPATPYCAIPQYDVLYVFDLFQTLFSRIPKFWLNGARFTRFFSTLFGSGVFRTSTKKIKSFVNDLHCDC